MRKEVVGIIMTGVFALVSAGSTQAMRLGCSDEQLDRLIGAVAADSRNKAEGLLQEGVPLSAVVSTEFLGHHRSKSLDDIDYMNQSPFYVMVRANKSDILRLFLERGLSGPAIDNEVSLAWCRGLPYNVVRLLVLAGIDFDNFGPCEGPHLKEYVYGDLACGRNNQVTLADIQSAKEERADMHAQDDIRRELCAALLFLPKDLAFLICDYRVCPKPEDVHLVTAPKVVINMPVVLPGEYAP